MVLGFPGAFAVDSYQSIRCAWASPVKL